MAEIAFVLGTRAELIKSFPVIKRIECDVIATGQHNLDTYAELFGIEVKYLSKPPEKSSRFMGRVARASLWSMMLLPRIRGAIKKYDGVLYHGDTMSTAAAALASKFEGKIGIHLEAGLRSFSYFEPFPEEIARKIADRFSSVLFSVSRTATENLKNERIRGRIFETGNTIVDSALEAQKYFRGRTSAPREFALITVHRHENIRNRERMKRIVEIICGLPLPSIFFMHDNTRKFLEKYRLMEKLREAGVDIRPLCLYPEFVRYEKKARIILTDGGSIQEESLIFKKPCFLLRYRTERVDALGTGMNFLTKLDVEWTLKKVEEVLEPGWKPPRFRNPYGERGVSDKIVAILKEILLN